MKVSPWVLVTAFCSKNVYKHYIYYQGLLRNCIDDTQCTSACDVMPLMKSCLLPCQQDRCCCSPLIQYSPLEHTANNLAVLNKKWHSGTAVRDSLPKSNTVRQFKSQSHYDCLMTEPNSLFSDLKTTRSRQHRRNIFSCK